MAARTLNHVIQTYRQASAMPVEVMRALMSKPKDSNCILPQVLKARDIEQRGTLSPPNQVWITCSSNIGPETVVEFVLSCTEGCMGTYPIFIFVANRAIHLLTEDYLYPRLKGLAIDLYKAVPSSRVYSVFAPDLVCKVFVGIWESVSGVRSYSDKPYYAAKLTYCTKATFVDQPVAALPNLSFELRPATEEDIPKIANLTFGFAKSSEPFTLDADGALKEAVILVRSRQVWVHTVFKADQPHQSEIASIVAFTRNSPTNATITKVYSSPQWRGQKCADRLVRRVCKHLLATKESVSLFVAHDNPAATHVYRNCGFVGLDNDSRPCDGVSSWLEIGFDLAKVKLGHW